MKVFLLCLVATATAAPQHPAAVYDPQDPPLYEFEYGVQADTTKYGQQEARDGPSTAGSYQVLLPDSRTQTVHYRVDGDGGYQASVEYDGEAQHEGGSTGGAYTAPVYVPRQSGHTAGGSGQSKGDEQVHGSAGSQPSYQRPSKSYDPYVTQKSYVAPTYGAKQTSTTPKPAYSAPSSTYAPPKSVRITTKPAYVSDTKTTYSPVAPPQSAPTPTYSASTTPSYPPSTPSQGSSRAAAVTEPSLFEDNKLRFERVPSDVYDKPLFRSEVENVHKGAGADKKSPEAGHRGEQAGPEEDSYIEPDRAALAAYKALEESEQNVKFGAKLSSFSDSKAGEEEEDEEKKEQYYPTFKTAQ